MLNLAWRLAVVLSLLLLFQISFPINQGYVFNICDEGAITAEQQHNNKSNVQRNSDYSNQIIPAHINIAEVDSRHFDSFIPLRRFLQIPLASSQQLHSVAIIFPEHNSPLLYSSARSVPLASVYSPSDLIPFEDQPGSLLTTLNCQKLMQWSKWSHIS